MKAGIFLGVGLCLVQVPKAVFTWVDMRAVHRRDAKDAEEAQRVE